MLKRLVASVGLAVIWAGVAAAGPFEDGEAAYRRGDYATAIQLLQPLAVEGNPFAQIVIGNAYAQGQGVPRDDVQAIKWFRLAADQGYAPAQFNLGLIYGNGIGVKQDYAEAVKWYRLAADRGHVRAQSNLAILYGAGLGVPRDLVLSYMWFTLAAARGDNLALKDRDTAAKYMTPAEIADAQRRARDWRPVP